MEIKPYLRHVNYYETDQMAIVHHSNYIRWFEEARLDFMDQIGVNYRTFEQSGLIIPVVDVSCKYLVSAKYDDTLSIRSILTQFTGVRMAFRYEVRFRDTGELAATGTSTHCFLDEDRKPVSIKRRDRALYDIMLSCVEPEEA